MSKLKVMTIVGTRPEIIRLSRVMAALDRHMDHAIVHTGQNYDYELSQIRPPCRIIPMSTRSCGVMSLSSRYDRQ
jgi:hypothetical protein